MNHSGSGPPRRGQGRSGSSAQAAAPSLPSRPWTRLGEPELVQSELAQSTWEDVLGNAQVEMTEQEQKDLADAVCALESLDNDQVEPLIQLFKGFGEGDISAMRSLLVDNDTTEIAQLFGALGSLSDSDIAKLASEVEGVSEQDLRELRDSANSVTDEDIAALQTFASETTPRVAWAGFRPQRLISEKGSPSTLVSSQQLSLDGVY